MPACGVAGVTGVLTYGVTALIGRRLGPDGFPTIGLAVLFALPAPTIALLGGAAMAAARKGRVPKARWYGPVAAAAVGLAMYAPLVARRAA